MTSTVPPVVLLTFLVDGAGLTVAGATLLRGRRTARTTGWALLAAGALMLLGAATSVAGLQQADVVGLAGLTTALPLALLAYPARPLSGHLPLALAAGIAVLGLTALLALPDPDAVAVVLTGTVAVLGCDTWVRVERSNGDARRSLLWLTYGWGVALVVGGHLVFLVDGGTGGGVQTAVLVAALLVSLVVPATLVVGALRPRLVDVRLLISRTVLYLLMLELCLALYVGAVSAADLLGLDPTPQALSLVVLALAAGFHPVARRVGRVLDELVYGASADPVSTMTAFAARLQSDTDPSRWADALREALSLPRVEIWQAGGVIAASGSSVEITASTPLVAGDEQVGALVVGLPGDATALPGATQGVLNLVSAPLARALQAVRLADELLASRGQVVSALEEERRRLRRDLHDGLGPVLTGIGYTAEAARNVVRDDPARAEELLAALHADTAAAIADIRRLVVGLRPPALDELGLVGAVRQQTSRLGDAAGRAIAVDVVQRDQVPALPAAVEVAAYRIAVEAVTNASRHAGASRVTADFSVVDHSLVLTVQDDGRRALAWRPGVGLSSMRERCEQVGGALEAGPTTSGGRVRATLPL